MVSGKKKRIKREGLGSELIESFVEQLDGTYSIQKGNGTTYVIVFPLRNKE
jgi:two-component sensor histidine kinase